MHKLGVLIDGKVTYGGLLVFGPEELLFKVFPNYRIDYLEIPGTTYSDGPTRYTFRLSSEKNLFGTFFDIYEHLVKKVEIPFHVKKGFRDDDPSHLQALREGLVNLIIHSDYFCKANPRIRVFTDRIEFFNPGALPKKIEDILKEDFSLPRNPVVAKIFRFIRLAENMGSGFHKMIDGWSDHYEVKPTIEGDFDYYKITFQTETKIKELGEKWSEKWSEKGVTVRQMGILELLLNNPRISRREISERLGINQSAVQKHLITLKTNEFIIRVGPAKGGHWEVVD